MAVNIFMNTIDTKCGNNIISPISIPRNTYCSWTIPNYTFTENTGGNLIYSLVGTIPTWLIYDNVNNLFYTYGAPSNLATNWTQNITVNATYGSKSAQLTYKLSVANVGSLVPIYTNTTPMYYILEHSTPLTIVSTPGLSSYFPNNNFSSYSILAGNYNTTFKINSITGVISINRNNKIDITKANSACLSMYNKFGYHYRLTLNAKATNNLQSACIIYITIISADSLSRGNINGIQLRG